MSNEYIIDISEVNEKDEPIEYSILVKAGHVEWINLTTAGVWVARRHLRPDDVRWTVVLVEEIFKNVPPTAAEKLVLLIQGIPYIESDYD